MSTLFETVARRLFFILPALAGLIASAQAQVRPTMVRSVDEPARVPYSSFLAPTCPFTNQCTATFPAVPAGKRLRLTQVSMIFFFSNGSGFFMLHKSPTEYALAWPVSAFNGAYYSALFSSNQAVDLVYEAGEAPTLEFGQNAGNTIFADSRNRFGVSGYLVDVAP